ncbi:Uncharacterised protein [Vibrio cholerae]|nr:Uncharacterised protein [Vibrio cholerae]CSH93039.1 Uncharacterised protein [Vibrio cholerae]
MVRQRPRISSVSVVAILPLRLMPSSKSPLVMPVAAKITLSLRAMSSIFSTLPASTPIC